MKKLFIILILLTLTACTQQAVTDTGGMGQVSLSNEEEKQLKFTQNLEAIDYSSIGQKDNKGIWIPTEKEFEEIYQYVYGFNMVNWQLPDGTSMCGVGREATNCVPHWEQQFENAKFRGELMKGVKANSVNGDIYFLDLQQISKKFNYKNLVKRFFEYIIETVYAAEIEFEDHFTVGATVPLQTHTPDTTGTGWTDLINVGTCNLYINSVGDYVYGADSRSSGGCANDNEGELNEGDDTMSGADYEISIFLEFGDTSDHMSQICCRIQDANNMYCIRYNSSDADLYIRDGGSWSTIDTGSAGVATNSTLVLKCIGTTISVEDDSVEILSASDATHSSAGKIGLGMGAVIVGTDGMNFQAIDDLVVTVAGAPPAVADEPVFQDYIDWD